MLKDSHGNALSGADAASLADYELALQQFRCYIGDPVATLDRAIAARPDFVMAHALKAYLLALSTEPEPTALARGITAVASRLSGNARERAHLEAVGHLGAGRWHDAGRALEDIAIEHPRDALALQVGHQIDFFTGEARMLRDRIARALPAWSPGMPGYHAMLGMHAFGLEETGDYAGAEAAGRKAVELEPRDGWAQHAVAHVMEMQGRQRDGIAWMRANPDAWSRESFFCVHNWWHLALYHLELGEISEVFALFDGPIYGGKSKIVLDMIDASALLWRLALRGIDVGARWNDVADSWASFASAGNYAFNDAHAMMAFAGAGRDRLAATVLETQSAVIARGTGDNVDFTREIGHPVAKAIKAFGDGDYAEAIRQLRPVRNKAARFGGSHAQRDLLDLTLIEAAFRSGQNALAAALTAERVAAMPTSPFARLLAERADAARSNAGAKAA